MMTHNQKSHEMMSNFHFRGHLRDLGLTSATANEMLHIFEVSSGVFCLLIKYKINVVATNADDDSGCENLYTNQTSTNGS